MAKPHGMSSRFGLGFDRGSYRYELTQLEWVVSPFPHWRFPLSAVGGVDLRDLSAQGTAGGAPQGFAFCASLQSTGGNAIATVPHMVEAVTTTAMQDAWQSATGYRPQGAKLADLLWDQLTTGSDPAGESGPKPLMPTTGGNLELHLGGHSLVKSERFRFGIHPHTGKVRDLLRRQFEARWEATNGDDHCRRVLDFTCRKYKVDDWQEFVPARLHAHVPGRLPHATTISDNFNGANSATLGIQLSWNEISGDWQNQGNEAQCSAGSQSFARATSDLSGDDNYAQADHTATGGSAGEKSPGPVCRFDASAINNYCCAHYGGDNNFYLMKFVGGTQTNLANASNTPSLPDTYKVQADGSTIKAFINGAEIHSVSDSAVTGHVRAGLTGYGTVTLDNFEAADLAAAGAVVGRGLTRSKLLNSPLLGRLVG